ncbi:hypothetical protein BT93_L2321 [Corymbia citriodora subsp. variegata]|uniref:Uncharacterized protein n=1 Tax=Corymbia citriodora subsp. variegata TaxID=360336 RepID=A0A8T0CMP8_CORYI|nr:hypothetical protein BT93_L2321 [Corymbia citriodora subsp. variegata]
MTQRGTCGTNEPDLISWVNENLKCMLAPDEEQGYWEKRSIYKVPAPVADLNHQAYWPQAVSFGPYHHDKNHLRPMESHKRRALLHFLRRSKKDVEDFLKPLSKVAQKLEDSYDSLDPKWKKGGDKGTVSPFLELMIIDGCFMLEILRTMTRWGGNPIFGDPWTMTCEGGDYAINDPIFGERGGLYIIPYIKRDMLMLENQLPMLVLNSLVAVEKDSGQDGEYINGLLLKFFHPIRKRIKGMGERRHVLDVFRKSLLLPDKPVEERPGDGQWIICMDKCRCVLDVFRKLLPKKPEGPEGWQWIIGSATELEGAGIRLKNSNTGRKSNTGRLNDISFAGGVLRLPFIEVNDTTESMFLNLMTFERFHHGAGNEVTAYVFFMDDIINTERDVTLLITRGIIQNDFGSDEAVAKLFNSLNKDMTLHSINSLNAVREKVSKHCKKPWNRWRASLIQTHFGSPWSILSLLAAIFLFTLTIIQTIYTVSPAG